MTIIYQNGYADFAVPINEKVAIFSNSPLKLFQQVGYPNHPTTWDLIYTTTAGEQYVSAAFSAAATVRVEASAADAFYEVGAAPVVGEPMSDISAADATFVIQGLGAAQGGYVDVIGGTSSTAGNAGGAAKLTGGQPGATGVGGAATVAAGAGGATSGNGGVASLTGGAGTAGNGVGGIGKVVGGAGNGSGDGGAGQVLGGAAGVTGIGGAASLIGAAGGATSGKGGAANMTAGAGTAGNGSGGSCIITPGAKHGSGLDGGVFNRGGINFVKMPTPSTATDTASLSDAQMICGILVSTPTAAAAYTMRTGTQLKAALPTDLTADDAFDLTIINLGGTGDDITLTAATDITIVGDPVVGPVADVATEQSSTGTFRIRFVSGTTFVAYRIK